VNIQENSIVEIRYRLLDKDGELVESTDEEGPIRYRHGSAEILPALENALIGASPGDQVHVTLEAEEAFGAHNPDGIVIVPRQELPDEEYSPGDWVAVGVEQEPGEQEEIESDELEMRVLEVNEDAVVMDANHPLAGQSVTFEVDVVSVEP
jgi:FKBP-type peptidyl-prolyl cis-trans isomerase SlyD